MKKISIVVMAAVALLVGCGQGSGSEYVGKWVNVKSDKRTLEIDRNGEGFILRETGPSFITGKPETKNIPATLKDGALQIQMGGFGAITMVVDKATGNLTNGQTEYKKEK